MAKTVKDQIKHIKDLLNIFEDLEHFEVPPLPFRAATFEKHLMHEIDSYMRRGMDLMFWGKTVCLKLKGMLKMLEAAEIGAPTSDEKGKNGERFETKPIRIIRTAKDIKRGEVAQSLAMFLEEVENQKKEVVSRDDFGEEDEEDDDVDLEDEEEDDEMHSDSDFYMPPRLLSRPRRSFVPRDSRSGRSTALISNLEEAEKMAKIKTKKSGPGKKRK
jgi:hypothetical protein